MWLISGYNLQPHSNHSLFTNCYSLCLLPTDNLPPHFHPQLSPSFTLTFWPCHYTNLFFFVGPSARSRNHSLFHLFTYCQRATIQVSSPFQFSFNSLERLPPLPPSCPLPEVLSAACCVSPVSTNRLDCRWWHVWNLWLIPCRARRNPLNRALLLALAGLCNNFALLSPLFFFFSITCFSLPAVHYFFGLLHKTWQHKKICKNCEMKLQNLNRVQQEFKLWGVVEGTDSVRCKGRDFLK